MMKDENNIEAISENVLQNNNPRLTSKYEDTDVIIDASASIPVARYLANNINNKARIVSIFFNPLGNDCVLIAEDKNRKFTLDALEIQYYKHLINNSELENHLQTGKRFRYARSCGDLSFVMQQDLVALHSSICTRAILETLRKEEASVVIWSTQLDDFTVKKHVVDLYNINKQIFKDWTLYYDEGLLRKVYDARISKLPKETGGILIGSYDTQRKIVYVTDTILSPSDSKEYPNSYIRGCQNLKEAEESIKEITLSRLQYVGEWHSHPKGFNTRPSNDDKKLFDWIKEIMKIDGYPPLMLIVGDKTNYTWYLGEIN